MKGMKIKIFGLFSILTSNFSKLLYLDSEEGCWDKQ